MRIMRPGFAVLLCAAWGCGGGGGTPDADGGPEVDAVDAPADEPPEELEDDGGGEDSADVPPVVPPRICRDPVLLGDDPFFTQATLGVGLGRDQLHVLGGGMVSGDIDGDGYPDLIVHRGATNLRDDPTNPDPTTYLRRVLLNRPGPGGGRVFEDWTVDSRYGQTRDGTSPGRSCNSAVFADVDNDGNLDVASLTWVDNSSTGNPDPGDRTEVLLNDGTGVFSLAAASAISPGPDEKWSTNSAALLDYDLDGTQAARLAVRLPGPYHTRPRGG